MQSYFVHDEDNPLWGWLMTGLLVLVGVTIGGLVAAALVRPPRETARAEQETAEAVRASAESKSPSAAKPIAVAAPQTRPAAAPAAKPAEPPPSLPPAQATKPAPAEFGPLAAAVPPKPPRAAKGASPPSPPPGDEEPMMPVKEPSSPAEPSAEEPAVKPAAEKPAEKAAPDNPQKRATFTSAVANIRKAMANRDMAAARRHLKLASTNMQNEADQAQFDRLQMMFENLDQFWDGIRSAVAKLQPTEEIEINKDTRVAVIEASRTELAVMLGGRRVFKIEDIPRGLLEALVNRSFQQTPGSMVIVGTFLMVDNQPGDREQAKKLFEEAAKKGLDLGKQLLPELHAEAPAPAAKQGTAEPAKKAPKRRR